MGVLILNRSKMANILLHESYLSKNRSPEDPHILWFGIKGTISTLASKRLMDKNTCRSGSKKHPLSAVYSVLST